jgi:hypothetical protein
VSVSGNATATLAGIIDLVGIIGARSLQSGIPEIAVRFRNAAATGGVISTLLGGIIGAKVVAVRNLSKSLSVFRGTPQPHWRDHQSSAIIGAEMEFAIRNSIEIAVCFRDPTATLAGSFSLAGIVGAKSFTVGNSVTVRVCQVATAALADINPEASLQGERVFKSSRRCKIHSPNMRSLSKPPAKLDYTSDRPPAKLPNVWSRQRNTGEESFWWSHARLRVVMKKKLRGENGISEHHAGRQSEDIAGSHTGPIACPGRLNAMLSQKKSSEIYSHPWPSLASA